MEDYHVFSSVNLTDWTDHGVIVSQNKVNRVDSTSFSMWAPDCIERNGKYYFYFPAGMKASQGRGSSVGVAIADNPMGPFKVSGAGLTEAGKEIQIDRFSGISEKGASIAFLDSLNTFKGWKTIPGEKGARVQYNAVYFGSKKLKSVQVNVLSKTGGALQIRLDNPDGQIVAEIKIPECSAWSLVNAHVSKMQRGIHNLIVLLKDPGSVEIDWVRFN